jgi:hypothetical protein
MSATVLLLKTQTRLLAWPLFALIAASVAIVCIPVDPLTGINCVVVILAMLLSGPVVFGAEYAEGARDYLDTRPVSQSDVFWFKVTLLILIAFVGCEVLAATIQTEYLASFTGFEPFDRVRLPGLLLVASFLSYRSSQAASFLPRAGSSKNIFLGFSGFLATTSVIKRTLRRVFFKFFFC